MQRFLSRGRLTAGFLLLAGFGLWGCDDATSLWFSRQLSVGEDNAQLEHRPGSFKRRIGTVAERVNVHTKPHLDSRILGTTVAGTLVPCSDEPVGREGCPEGWYAIVPRGYLCLNDKTTLNENHPTLKARALGVNSENTLPYPYAVTRRDASLYELDPKHRDGVREQRKIQKGSVFAVVGSWNTLDEFDQRQHLALLTSGQFVSVRDIEPARFPKSFAVSLDGINHKLPLAFVTAKGSTTPPALELGQPIELTGTSRLVDGERRWARVNGGEVRDRDAVVVRKRQEFPSFVGTTTHYADLDLERGTLVLYEGKTPAYATVVMRLPKTKPPVGTSYVQSKQITVPAGTPTESDGSERRDLAWVIELDNGLLLQAATGRSGFRETSAEGAVELHPDDARRLFQWLSPALPESWHGVVVSEPTREGSPILLH